MTPAKVLVKAYVTEGLKSELRDECERSGKSESAVVTEALRSHLQWKRNLAQGGAGRGY